MTAPRFTHKIMIVRIKITISVHISFYIANIAYNVSLDINILELIKTIFSVKVIAKMAFKKIMPGVKILSII